MKIDHELLTACVINPWSIVPRMMLIDSMIENGWEEFKAMESFEPPTLSRQLPLNYNIGIFNGGSGFGFGFGSGFGSCFSGGNGSGSNSFGRGNGRGHENGHGIGLGHNTDHSNGMILEQQ